jgi:hypothetical protein
MAKIPIWKNQNDLNPEVETCLVLEYWNLELVCNLVLVIWNFP